MTVGERIILIIKELNLNKSSFAEALGYKNNTQIVDFTNGVNKPKHDFYERLLQAFPSVNIEWVIIENGSPFKEIGTAATKNDEAAVRELLANLRSQVAYLSDRNTELTRAVLNFSESKVIKQG